MFDGYPKLKGCYLELSGGSIWGVGGQNQNGGLNAWIYDGNDEMPFALIKHLPRLSAE